MKRGVQGLKGFIDFIRNYGVIGLAVGFILGGALSSVVSALVNDIINPILGVLLGATEGLTHAKPESATPRSNMATSSMCSLISL